MTEEQTNGKPLKQAADEMLGNPKSVEALLNNAVDKMKESGGNPPEVEIPTPTSEQMTALWIDLWNTANNDRLKAFFANKEGFPVTAENYNNYADTFFKHFDAMRQILEGKGLSEIEISEKPPEASYPFQHEVQYSSVKKPQLVVPPPAPPET